MCDTYTNISEAISGLFASESNQLKIDYLPSNSTHRHTAKNILNELLKENPEWKTPIFMLASYPIQEWAEQCENRKEKASSILSGLEPYVEKESGEEFHFFQEDGMYYTNEIVLFIQLILSGDKQIGLSEMELKTLRSIHDVTEDEVSYPTIQKYYKSAVAKFCKKTVKGLERISNKFNKKVDKIDFDIRIVLHDTDNLVKLIPDLRAKQSSSSYDYSGVLNTMDDFVKYLKTYPIIGHDIYMPVRRIMNGLKEYDICKLSGLSNTLIQSRYQEGIRALSYLLFGYSAKDILLVSRSKSTTRV